MTTAVGVDGVSGSQPKSIIINSFILLLSFNWIVGLVDEVHTRYQTDPKIAYYGIMHLNRPSLALSSVSGEPIVDGYLNPRAALITPAPRQHDEPGPCEYYLGYLSGCQSSTANFYDLSEKEQANCLCCDFPEIGCYFDRYVSICLQALENQPFLQQDETRIKSVSVTWMDFCLRNYTPSPTTTQPRPARWSTPTPSPVANLDACSTMLSVLTSCENKSPGFMTMDITTQAACLCYTSMKWAPDMWNSAVASCATEAPAASSMSLASVASKLEGLCHSVSPLGDPSMTPTPTPMPTPTPIHASSSNHAGEIAGGVVGGIGGLALIVGAGIAFFGGGITIFKKMIGK